MKKLFKFIMAKINPGDLQAEKIKYQQWPESVDPDAYVFREANTRVTNNAKGFLSKKVNTKSLPSIPFIASNKTQEGLRSREVNTKFPSPQSAQKHSHDK